MAMLAEKKRRQKWCLNPRGKEWSDDQTKFGQRLLEKMGWSAGQGLGAANQGPTEIIKVKIKDDSKGLGYKDNGEEWLKTTNDYNELLDQLRNTEVKDMVTSDVPSSLEERSQKSKARVHYHKFTRGKDLSQYSRKDLESIIGPDVVRSKTNHVVCQNNGITQLNNEGLSEGNDVKCLEQLAQVDVNEQTIHSADTEVQASYKKNNTRRKLTEETVINEESPYIVKKRKTHNYRKNEVSTNECNDHLPSNLEKENNVTTNIIKFSHTFEDDQGSSSKKYEIINEEPTAGVNSYIENIVKRKRSKSQRNVGDADYSYEPLKENNDESFSNNTFRKKNKHTDFELKDGVTNELLLKTTEDAKDVEYNENIVKKKKKKKAKELINSAPCTEVEINLMTGARKKDKEHPACLSNSTLMNDSQRIETEDTNVHGVYNNIDMEVDRNFKPNHENPIKKKKRKKGCEFNEENKTETEFVKDTSEADEPSILPKLRNKKTKNKIVNHGQIDLPKIKKNAGRMKNKVLQVINMGTSTDDEVFANNLGSKESARDHPTNNTQAKNTNLDCEEGVIIKIPDAVLSRELQLVHQSSKKRKKSKNLIDKCEDCVREVMEQSLISKKRKKKIHISEQFCSDKATELESEITSINVKEVNNEIISDHFDLKKKKKEIPTLCFLDKEPQLQSENASQLQLVHQSKKRKKSKNLIDNGEDCVSEGMEQPLMSKKTKKKKHIPELLCSDKAIELESEITSTNANEGSISKPDKDLKGLNHKALLRNIKIPPTHSKSTKIDTTEYMEFVKHRNNSTNDTASKPNNSDTMMRHTLGFIFATPTDKDTAEVSTVAVFEYRLVLYKMKQLSIPTGPVKVIINDNLYLSKKSHNKLKYIYKSKYLKSLLPASEVTFIERFVNEFSSHIKPKVEMIDALTELENQISELATSSSHNSGLVKNKERLNSLKEQLQKVSKENLHLIETESGNSSFGICEEIEGKQEIEAYRKMSKDTLDRLNVLQARLEDKLRFLSQQLEMLTSGKKLVQENHYNKKELTKQPVFKDTSVRQSRGYNRISPNTDKSVEVSQGSEYMHTSKMSRGFRPGSLKSFTRGHGRGYGLRQGTGRRAAVRGRISQNNFDAKMYAHKCKTTNKLPELAFKGVDLNMISGYAAAVSFK